jgi:hypothetical protein
MSCNDCNDVTLLAGNDGVGIQTIVDNGDGTFTLFLTDGSTFTTPNFAATATAGVTTTLAPGSPATVTNSGTTQNAIFDFGIPEGQQGAQGPQGPQGDQGFGLLPERTVSLNGDLGLAAINKLTTIGNAANPVTITIQPNATIAFDAGQTFILQKIGTGVITIQAAGGVTLNGTVGGSFVINNQWEGAMLIQGAIDIWFIIRMGT